MMPRVRVVPVAVFLALSFGLAWLVALPLWLDPAGLAAPAAPFLLPVMMFTPTAATVVVVLALRAPREHRRAFLAQRDRAQRGDEVTPTFIRNSGLDQVKFQNSEI